MFGLKKQSEKRVLRLIDENASFAYTEAYKSLRTNVDFLLSTNNYRTILVTSAGPRDGKTNVTINLAIALGNSGKRVLLVDCDFRKASVATYLKISRRLPGATAVLSGKSKVENVIVRRPDLHIDVLPVGIMPTNPSEVLGSAAMVTLIQKLGEEYDYVLFDTPPASVVTDATILSRFVDGVVLVARSAVTTRQALAVSKKNLEDVNARILGVVLNDYNPKDHGYGKRDYYSYSYKYGSYGEKKK